MDKQLEEYILDLEEIKAYRSLEGVSFDFGTGLIENELSYGTEEALWEMEQQNLEEIIDNWDSEKQNTKKKKHKLNHYNQKQIDKIKLKKLANHVYTIYFNDKAGIYKRFYISGCRKYAKWCTNRTIRHRNDFPLKYSGYRKTFDYSWCIW
jgi:hypothetical protein